MIGLCPFESPSEARAVRDHDHDEDTETGEESIYSHSLSLLPAFIFRGGSWWDVVGRGRGEVVAEGFRVFSCDRPDLMAVAT